MISPLLRRYTWNSAWLYNVRIFIALCGTTLFPWWIGEVKLTIPLTLGVVAAALTDLDDRLAGRLRNLAITLVCFFIASASVELLFPWPPLFALGLTVSTIGFILLGGLGQRYATIAFGALLIAIYTMLGVTLYDHWYLQPLFLLAGAVWYNLLTLSGHLIFPIRPLQDNLARSYEQLARYLELKSRLFDPDLEDESQAPLYDLALANGQLVATLNQTKVSLLTRLRGDRGQRGTRRTLQYYFVAQDIHERASSSHIQYQTLRDQFRYSDVMFRFQRMLSMQAQACQKLSRAILLREPYQHDAHFERAFMHLDAALERVRAGGASDEQLNALGYLLNNLRAIDAQLATIESVQTTAPAGSNTETLLADDRLGGLSDIWLRLQRNMSPESALFRHAVRMSLVLCAGYAFIQFTGLQHGYWILLTSLFVCQPNYNATRHRLALRIIGTLVGVAIGLPVLLLVIFKVPIILGFTLASLYAMLVCGKMKSFRGVCRTINKDFYDGVVDTAPLVGFLLMIPIFNKSAELCVPYFNALLGGIIPNSTLVISIFFAVLAPLGLFRGPFTLFGCGAATLGILKGIGFSTPYLYALMVIPSITMNVSICMTQSWIAWGVSYAKVSTREHLKKTLPYAWITCAVMQVITFVMFG